jgi:hypothetical protein
MPDKKKEQTLLERIFGSKKIKGVKGRTQLGDELKAPVKNKKSDALKSSLKSGNGAKY